MTKAELLEKLKACRESDDPEFAHGEADDALVEFINDEEVAEAFYAVERWYA